jgi:hypothetical protein
MNHELTVIELARGEHLQRQQRIRTGAGRPSRPGMRVRAGSALIRWGARLSRINTMAGATLRTNPGRLAGAAR